MDNTKRLLNDENQTDIGRTGRDMTTVLTIAGSDCSGGAGIQADLKTMTVLGAYGMSVITALTAQNTMGVSGVFEVTPEFVGQQLDSVFQDIFPDAVKIGMVSNLDIVRVITRKLKGYSARHIVVDPVMISTSGSSLIDREAIAAMTTELFPLAEVVTPNLFEAEVLSGITIINREAMEKAAEIILKYGSASVLVKGGHMDGKAEDYLLTADGGYWLSSERIDNHNTHGTGCTLSSAIATNLANGDDIHGAVETAKQYVTGAIADGLDLGHGRGPLNHMYALKQS